MLISNRLQEQQQLQKLRPNIVITNIPYTVTKQIIPSPLTPNSTEFLLDSELASVDENQEVIILSKVFNVFIAMTLSLSSTLIADTLMIASTMSPQAQPIYSNKIAHRYIGRF